MTGVSRFHGRAGARPPGRYDRDYGPQGPRAAVAGSRGAPLAIYLNVQLVFYFQRCPAQKKKKVLIDYCCRQVICLASGYGHNDDAFQVFRQCEAGGAPFFWVAVFCFSALLLS